MNLDQYVDQVLDRIAGGVKQRIAERGRFCRGGLEATGPKGPEVSGIAAGGYRWTGSPTKTPVVPDGAPAYPEGYPETQPGFAFDPILQAFDVGWGTIDGSSSSGEVLYKNRLHYRVNRKSPVGKAYFAGREWAQEVLDAGLMDHPK